MPEFSNKTHYNAEEAARELDRSAPEIESLILSGRLQTEIVDGKRVIPAQALEDFHAGISLPDIKARVILEEGNNDRLVEPDQIAILPENSDAVESHNADPEGAYYYSPSQAAELLSTNLLELNTLVNRGELPAVSINKHRWLPAKAVEDLVRQRYGPGKLKHAPQPRRIQQLGNKVPREPQVETDATADKRSRSVNSPKPQNSQTEDYRDTKDTREYFTPEQIAFALQRTQRDIDRMIQWDEIKTATINGHRWVLKEEAERIISRREPQRQVRIRRRLPQPHKISEQPPAKTSPNVISDMELVDAAQRFGISTNKIRQMITTGELARHPSSNHLIKSTSDSSGETNVPETEETSPSTPPVGDHHYSPVEAAEKLGKLVDDVWEMIYRDELPVFRVNGERMFSKRVIDDLALENHPEPIQGTSSRSSERNEDELQTSQDSEAEVTEGYYYTPGQAARLLGKDAYEINLMIHRKLLPVVWVNGKRWIPEQSVDARMPKSDQRKWNKDDERPEAYQIRNPESQTDQEAGKDVTEAEAYSSSAELKTSTPRSETELKEEIEMLRDELRGERELNCRLSEELEQAREEHQRDIRDAQYEIDQLDAELENIRKNTNNTILGSRLKQEREFRDEAEGWARELEAQVEKESVLSSQRERLFADMEVKLNGSKARNQELEQTLSSEREKSRRLEGDTQVLAQVQRLLGMKVMQPPEQSERANAPEDTSKSEQDEAPDELLIQTRHGQWIFRPPFALEEEEIALIQLVVGADEITAGQIKHRTGRRRAADDLDDLLERLAAEGMEPIKVNDDRYSFDPDFLQN